VARSSQRKRDAGGGSIKGLLIFLLVFAALGAFFLVPWGAQRLTTFAHLQVWLKLGERAPPPADQRPAAIEEAPNAAKSRPMEELTAEDEAAVQRVLREKTSPSGAPPR
jgi:hypothetical protein